MKVLIDPGHGIDTPGKRSPDGRFLEYKWNREVASYLVNYLKSSGIDTSLVVTETNDISLRTRAMRVNKVCNQVGSSNVILVSIHSNAAGNGKSWMNAQGWSCYTSPGKTRADDLGQEDEEGSVGRRPGLGGELLYVDKDQMSGCPPGELLL